jgi:hypothetical protein
MEESINETGSLLRLEIAMSIHGFGRCWCLLDWVKDESRIPAEMQRILNRFTRISLSLERQAKGVQAKNEPYRDVVGVRCRMGSKTIGVWLGQHIELEKERTATSNEWAVERDYENWKKSKVSI